MVKGGMRLAKNLARSIHCPDRRKYILSEIALIDLASTQHHKGCRSGEGLYVAHARNVLNFGYMKKASETC